MEFFNGQTKLGEDTSAPYTYDWTGVAVGSLLDHRARDRHRGRADHERGAHCHGQRQQRAEREHHHAGRGRAVHRAGDGGDRASASDPQGVAIVEFFNGTTKLGQDTSAPYTYDWTGVPAGSYSITARATDTLGAQTTSAARTVTVNRHQRRADSARSRPRSTGTSFRWKPTRSRSTPPRAIQTASSLASSSTAADGATLLGSDTTAAVLVPVEERPDRYAPAAGEGVRQPRRRDDQRRGVDHGAGALGARGGRCGRVAALVQADERLAQELAQLLALVAVERGEDLVLERGLRLARPARAPRAPSSVR